jgi:TPR repeat protein
LGHRDAQYNLGVLYSAGKGVPKDYPLSLKWLRMAAEQNCPDAQFLLGKFLARGKAGKAGEIEAVRWLELAAEQGNEEAKQLISVLKPQNHPVGVS